MNVLARINGVTPLLVVHANGGGKGDEVDVGMGEEVVVVGEMLGQAELGGSGVGTTGSRIADRHELDGVSHIGL